MKRRRIYCNSCANDTWHEIAAHYEQERVEPLFGEKQNLEAEILHCCGCDLIAFRLVTHPFAFQDKDDKPQEELLPERAHKTRRRKYFFSMPGAVRTLYQETATAHDGKLILLSAVGLRALIEAIVVDRIDKAKYTYTLESKINALSTIFEPGVLDTLHDFRKVGNEAVHAQVTPDYLDIHRALFVVESIMEYFYGVAEGADTYQKLKAKPKANAKPKGRV